MRRAEEKGIPPQDPASENFQRGGRAHASNIATDPSGAVVRKAKVTVREVTTGLTRSEVTNDEGEYSIPQLPAGHYDLVAEAPDFKKTELTGIELQVDDRLRKNVTLAVG